MQQAAERLSGHCHVNSGLAKGMKKISTGSLPKSSSRRFAATGSCAIRPGIISGLARTADIPALRKEILRLHSDLAFTLVYVTHNCEEAQELGSLVISLRHGRVDDSASAVASFGTAR
jgi:ABC-type thiamine transport system ATPase subunit